MSAGAWGQLVTSVAALILAGVWLYHLGFFRGWRRARETDAATVNHLSRIGIPGAELRVVRGSYRRWKTPAEHPPLIADHDDGV